MRIVATLPVLTSYGRFEDAINAIPVTRWRAEQHRDHVGVPRVELCHSVAEG